MMMGIAAITGAGGAVVTVGVGGRAVVRHVEEAGSWVVVVRGQDAFEVRDNPRRVLTDYMRRCYHPFSVIM